jgi:hypothetical protein
MRSTAGFNTTEERAMIAIEVRSSGRSKNVWARGTWEGTSLPWWHACTALDRAEADVKTYEPRDGVAILIRVRP